MIAELPLPAQEQSKYYLGAGVGVSIIGEQISKNEIYNSTLLLLQGGINLTPHRDKFPLIIKIEANVGISNLSTRGARDFDLAAIVGIETVLPLSKKTALTASASTGPGYMAAEIQKQAEGFIFSNNFSFTVIIKISDKGFYVRPGYRFRHMSSLDITLPNYGVDHQYILLTAGVLFGGALEETR